jgi:hypothetical protein
MSQFLASSLPCHNPIDRLLSTVTERSLRSSQAIYAYRRHLPWQKRCERTRWILAEGVLRQKRPGEMPEGAGTLFRNASAIRDSVAQVLRSTPKCLRNAFSKAKRNFQAGKCSEALSDLQVTEPQKYRWKVGPPLVLIQSHLRQSAHTLRTHAPRPVHSCSCEELR